MGQQRYTEEFRREAPCGAPKVRYADNVSPVHGSTVGCGKNVGRCGRRWTRCHWLS